MVTNLADFAHRRQQVVEAALPSGGVLPVPQAPGLGRVEDRLDPTADSSCRFGLDGPDRFEHREDVLDADGGDRHAP